MYLSKNLCDEIERVFSIDQDDSVSILWFNERSTRWANPFPTTIHSRTR
jgi:hypothetical protein